MIFTLIIVMTNTSFGKTYYVDLRDGLNVRSEPSLEAEILGTLSFGTQIASIKDEELRGTKWRKFWWANSDGINECAYVCTDGLDDEDPMKNFTYMGNWHITAYTHTGNVCANGNYPTAGYTIACNSLDFGTRVYINGIGFRVVEDRGPAWLGGEWIDIFYDQRNTCIEFGEKYLDIYIVKEE